MRPFESTDIGLDPKSFIVSVTNYHYLAQIGTETPILHETEINVKWNCQKKLIFFFSEE